MNKKDVRVVGPLALNSMVKHDYINNVSVVSNASKHLFGKHHTIEFVADNTGLSYGSPKATTYANYALCQATASQRLYVSKTIGLSDRLRKNIITKRLNTLSMMRHTSIKMAAS